MKNQFLKIKKHRSVAAQIRVEDPAEGGGGCAQIRRREEAALSLVVAEVGKEGVGGRRSASWSLKWGRRASVGAPRGRGHRGGEGGRRWVPLVVILVAVGAEVARRLPPPPRHAAADRLRLTMPPPTASTSPSPATAMPPPTAQIVASPKPEKREKREDRMRGEKRERTQREDKKGDDPHAEIFFSLARAPVGFDFLAAHRARALVLVV
jgi:hypothetical protein